MDYQVDDVIELKNGYYTVAYTGKGKDAGTLILEKVDDEERWEHVTIEQAIDLLKIGIPVQHRTDPEFGEWGGVEIDLSDCIIRSDTLDSVVLFTTSEWRTMK
jgi:hypothetical protein